MKILLTGANGHLGSNIARSLLKRQYDVIAFVRETSDLRGLEGLDLTYTFGDVLDQASFKKAAKGCDVIIHTAAVYKWWMKDTAVMPSKFKRKRPSNLGKDKGIYKPRSLGKALSTASFNSTIFLLSLVL